MLRPHAATGLTLRCLKEETVHWHNDKNPNQPEPPMKASGMISCSRGASKNRNACACVCVRWHGEKGREANSEKDKQQGGNDNQKYVIDGNKYLSVTRDTCAKRCKSDL